MLYIVLLIGGAVQDGTYAAHNLTVLPGKPQAAVGITVCTVLFGIESVHFITDEHGHIHVTILVQVNGNPEEPFLVLGVKDLLNYQHRVQK